jgi:hypothetical protein
MPESRVSQTYRHYFFASGLLMVSETVQFLRGRSRCFPLSSHYQADAAQVQWSHGSASRSVYPTKILPRWLSIV